MHREHACICNYVIYVSREVYQKVRENPMQKFNERPIQKKRNFKKGGGENIVKQN